MDARRESSSSFSEFVSSHEFSLESSSRRSALEAASAASRNSRGAMSTSSSVATPMARSHHHPLESRPMRHARNVMRRMGGTGAAAVASNNSTGESSSAITSNDSVTSSSSFRNPTRSGEGRSLTASASEGDEGATAATAAARSPNNRGREQHDRRTRIVRFWRTASRNSGNSLADVQRQQGSSGTISSPQPLAIETSSSSGSSSASPVQRNGVPTESPPLWRRIVTDEHVSGDESNETSSNSINNTSMDSAVDISRLQEVRQLKKALDSLKVVFFPRPPERIVRQLEKIEQWTDECAYLRQEVVSLGGLTTLMQLMDSHAQNSDIQSKLCTIFTYMARDMSCLAAITDRGAIQRILMVMRRHAAVALVQARALNALNNLAMQESNRIQIAESGGIPRIVTAMRDHLPDADVQANGSNCLWNLAICVRNRGPICQAHGVETVLQAMSRHLDNSALLGEASGCLWNLADHPPSRWGILLAGGVRVILSALARHPRQLIMHRLCCGALESLLQDSDLGRVLLARDDGIPIIVDILGAHDQDDEELQSACCGILASLAMGDLMNMALTTPFAIRIAEAGGIPLLIQALNRFPNASKVQRRCCNAIMNLSYDSTTRALLVQHGAISGVQRTIMEHPDDTVVFNTALLALSQVSLSLDVDNPLLNRAPAA